MQEIAAKWRPRALALGLSLVLFASAGVAWSAGAQVYGSGALRTPGSAAAFMVQLDDTTPLAFTYWDYSSDPPRLISMGDPTAIECLGELFGGQTIRLTGWGTDSATPTQTVSVQIFLVDGREASPDRLSLKASRADGAVVYFAPLRDLESGALSVSCLS